MILVCHLVAWSHPSCKLMFYTPMVSRHWELFAPNPSTEVFQFHPQDFYFSSPTLRLKPNSSSSSAFIVTATLCYWLVAVTASSHRHRTSSGTNDRLCHPHGSCGLRQQVKSRLKAGGPGVGLWLLHTSLAPHPNACAPPCRLHRLAEEKTTVPFTAPRGRHMPDACLCQLTAHS